MMFLPYRLPVDSLRNGGFEVDIVAARAAAYVLRVRRPSRWDNFIFRTEQHFHILRKNLLKELGPKIPIPELPGSVSEALRRADSHDAVSIRSAQSPRSPNLASGFDSFRSRANSRQASHVGTIDEGEDSSDEEVKEGQPRSKAARRLQQAAFAGPAVTYKVPTPELLQKASREGIAQWPAKADMRARADPKKGRLGRPSSTSSPPASVQSLKLRSDSKLNLSLAEGDEVLTAERASRAKDLRKWLRAVLAIKAVGHSRAMQSFLVSGKVLEDELKKEKPAVYEGIAAQESKVTMRMEAAHRDAAMAGEMVDEIAALAQRCFEGGT